ncbi:hypothetical protein C1H46_008722 [Malus baccata]|uniref:Uncharacterized protein n=1 Tax=Malus baccata TaxID=106549 RepID=A0A540N580_MALBA|nr:hypothetical protein C1H46_008722 [Malus baccata]
MSEAAKDPAIKLFGKTIPVLSFDSDSVGVARAPKLSRKRLSIRTAPPPPPIFSLRASQLRPYHRRRRQQQLARPSGLHRRLGTSEFSILKTYI